MDYEKWEPLYDEITKEFGFSKTEDKDAAMMLAEICRNKLICDRSCLGKAIDNRVIVCGLGPNLECDLEKADMKGTIIAADGATKVLMDHKILPNVIVTDLDGELRSQISANQKGAIAVILAHGDNIDKIRTAVPMFNGLITPTTQGKPFDGLENFGGFTDGDRAVLLARHFGAIEILLIGFDFKNPRRKANRNPQLKLRKLQWAKRLIFEMNPREVTLSTP